MEVLDISIANVSLQHIAGDLSASQDESTWILTSYLVTNAIVLPMSGWLSSVFGRKRFYLACIVGFGASSLLCGLAPSLALLIVFRAIQGLTGGGLQPTSQAILADAFPPRQRGMAFAFYGIAVVFAPAIGPTLGGWITDNYSWHWVFLINVPVSVALSFVIKAMIQDPPHLVAARARRRGGALRIDYLGFGLLALGLGSLQVMLDKGQEDDWFSSGFITAAALIAGGCLLGLVVWELHRNDPIVDLRLLKDKNFALANLLMFMLGFILLGSTAILPLYVQALLGYTATDAGMVLSPGGFAIMLIMPLIGRLVTRIDVRHMIAFGLVVSALSLYEMSGLDLEVDFWTIALYRIVQAIGLSFLFIPINTAAYVGISQEKSSNAAALINLSRNLGGSVGIAALTTLLAQRAQFHQNMLVEHISPYSRPYLDMAGALQRHMQAFGGSPAQALLKAQGVIAQSLQQQAQLLSYLDDFLILAGIFIALVPLVYVMRRPNAGAEPGLAH
jgi:DHA2 family multidrug resistance protein